MGRELWILAEFSAGEMDSCSVMVAHHAAKLAGEDAELKVRGIALVGDDEETESFAVEFARLGIAQVLLIKQPDTSAAKLTELVRSYSPSAMLVPGTHCSTELATRVAAGLDLPLVPDCTELAVVNGQLSFAMTIAGGMAAVDAEIAEDKSIIAVMPQRDAPAVSIAEITAPAVEIVEADYVQDVGGVEALGINPVSPEDISLAEAQIIISGGRGVGGPEGFEPLFELAKLVDGHVGASRVTTDLGWISKEHLVGMSGSTVRPAIYLALGISGDPHHLMGMRDATTIVAVNTDPKAPIFKVAQHALLCEAEPVVQRTIERLSELRSG